MAIHALLHSVQEVGLSPETFIASTPIHQCKCICTPQGQGTRAPHHTILYEQVYNTSYSSTLLEGSDSLRQIKKHLLKADKALTWSSVSEHRSLQLLPDSIAWPRVWDTAREYGAPGTKSIQAIFKMLTRSYTDHSCPYCGNSTTIPEESLFAEHVTCSTMHLRIDVGEIITHLESNEEEVFDIGADLKSMNAQS